MLLELFRKAGLECPPDCESIEIKNIVTDSKKVEKGSLFICLRGRSFDGHKYIDSAIEAGAAVIIAEQKRDVCVGGAAAYIMLDNTRKVTALLYNAWYGRPTDDLKIIGVTGTNGKTSVTTMLYEIFSFAGYRCGLIGTVCRLSADGRALARNFSDPLSNMTTPDPEELYALLAQMVKDRVEYVFMEVSSHALFLSKVDAIHFEYAVFTNLTQDHLDFHESMEDYYRAKRKLFSMSRKAFICIDGEYGNRLAKECECPFFTLSVNKGDFCALDVIMYGSEGSEYKLVYPDGEGNVKISVAGSFGVINSLTAAAVSLDCKIPFETLTGALLNAKGAKGRMEKVELPDNDITVIIDYAHTPDALEKLLLNVRSIKETDGRIILVFGCGGERDRSKRKAMALIASRLSDMVIVTSDNSRGEDPNQIFSDILKGIDKEKNHTVIDSRSAAIENAVVNARSGDIVVLAGKGHENYEINAEGKIPFDETKIVKTSYAKRRKVREET